MTDHRTVYHCGHPGMLNVAFTLHEGEVLGKLHREMLCPDCQSRVRDEMLAHQTVLMEQHQDTLRILVQQVTLHNHATEQILDALRILVNQVASDQIGASICWTETKEQP